MAEYPYMRLWTDAYLSDTVHLTTIEHGAYLLLLMCMWRNGGTLPDDDKMLARYTRLGGRQWLRIKPVLASFFDVSNGTWTQRRLTEELVAVRQRQQIASDSANARWLKNKDITNANAMRQTCYSKPEPYKEKKYKKKPSPDGDLIAGKFNLFWDEYPRRKPSNPKAPASKKFTAAVRRGVDPDEIISGARMYASALGEKVGTEFVAHATTWLNQERWKDSYEEQIDEFEARRQAARERIRQSRESDGEELCGQGKRLHDG